MKVTKMVGSVWNRFREYPRAKRIHLILDNYGIHKSQFTKMILASCQGKVRLHFSPPYCPDEDRIERVWLDLHANVTRNCTNAGRSTNS